MNGAVYISFFQGQLESVLEQVVQLAVQEISKSVGSSLNALLLETAVKEQENRRLRLQLQARDGGRGSPPPAGSKAGNKAGSRTSRPGEERAEGTEPGGPSGTRRLEQRGRVVDQLKSVMEQVLDFAVRELTKIVEASFDDLLLEITKMESEQLLLEQRLGGGTDRGGRRRGSENDSVSPSGSEDTEVSATKERGGTGEPARAPVLSVSQDWVPILDKVFGQRWCRDVWQIKEISARGRVDEEEGAGPELVSAPPLALEPSPSSPQQDPRWTPLEDMEVFSPDNEQAEAGTPSSNTRPQPGGQIGPGHGAPLSPKRRRSSASMLHRLLTLPSQLMEDDEEPGLVVTTDGSDRQSDAEPPDPGLVEGVEEEDEEDEGEDEEDKGRKRKRRRIWSECEECGRRFSRMSLLKAHRQSHASSRNDAPPTLHCSDCGKRFSSATRLHSHTHTQHPTTARP